MEHLPGTVMIEKFHVEELSELRADLLQSGLDFRQVAEVLRAFLTQRGYGVSFAEADKAAVCADVLFGPLQRMQETLEKVAVSM